MSAQESPVRFEFDVGTLNVCDSERMRRQRAGNAALVIARKNFGTVGLQEVTREHREAIDVEMPGHIKHYIEPYGHEKSGIMAVIDPDVFESAQSHRPNSRLSTHPLLVTELTSHTGQEIIIATEHHPSEFYLEFHRIATRLLLIEYLKQYYPNIPTVIVGDTNSPKAAPLTLVTHLAGFRSAHKDFHGREPKRTYPLEFGDKLIKSGADGDIVEVLASRTFRKLGNLARTLRLIDDDHHDSPHAGLDLERICVSKDVQVLGADTFADDQPRGAKTISDHAGLEAHLGI